MTTNELTRPATDNFALAAASATSAIAGERIRFAKGLYLRGRGDGERVKLGAVFHALDVQAGWVKFEDGKVVDQRIGYPLPAREDLDDYDEEDWPRGVDGKPADPWANQRYLYLLDPETGEDFTFVTSSWGGRAAVEALARQVYNRRMDYPGAIAVVRLDVGFKRSLTYGNVPAPRFTITGWAGIPEETAPAPRDLGRDLDDEIPF